MNEFRRDQGAWAPPRREQHRPDVVNPMKDQSANDALPYHDARSATGLYWSACHHGCVRLGGSDCRTNTQTGRRMNV